jgi:chromosome segregation ATPase
LDNSYLFFSKDTNIFLISNAQKLSSSTVKLENDNKRLAIEMAEAKAQIKDTEKEMRRLEKAGKDQTSQYKELEATLASAQADVADYTKKIRENTNAIDDNNKKIETAIKEMKLEDMTMNQLKNRAASLQKQLSNTSKSANPEEYKKLEKELDDVKKQMGALGERSKSLCDTLNTMRGVLLANIATKIGSKIQEWAKAAVEFTKEGIKMAAAAQGVEEAFNRIATKEDLKSLQTDTKGLVNDFELMKATVKAENFNIPLNQLGKLLQFAQQRAKDTGESVDYLVDSIVNGIGRKSPLILDNLGISASKLNAEVKKTGDFAGAVAKIVEEEMGKVGESIDMASEIATQKAVALENLQLALGKRFLGMQEAWDKMTTGLVQGLTKLVEVEKSHKEQYADQIQKVADLEVNTANLVRRYDELKTKRSLSKDEQIELNKIINTLRATVPGIVTEFDKYGNALSINTQKVWDYIAAEKAKLAVMNRKSIKEQTKNLENYTDKLSRLESQYASGSRTVMQQTSNFGTFTSYEVQLTGEELTKLENEISKYKQLVLGTQSWIDEMNGTTIENQLNAQKEVVTEVIVAPEIKPKSMNKKR